MSSGTAPGGATATATTPKATGGRLGGGLSDRALRRLKKKLDREQTLVQVRLHRRFEKPSARKRKKEKAARFAAMLKARYADQ